MSACNHPADGCVLSDVVFCFVSGEGARGCCLANTAVTSEHYIKQTRQERRAQQARKVEEIAEQRQMAAAVLGAGLKQQSLN